jgi:hypothetical protein
MAAVTYLSAGMSPAQMKQILNITKDNWVSFRNYNGKQLLYFTHLESYTCGIKEVHYGLNSDTLDRVWLLQPCDPKNPLSIKKDIVYLTMPLGYAKSVAVQVIFADGTKSELVHKVP